MEGYQELPDANWKDFKGGKYNPGVMAVQPTIEMLGDEPFPRMLVNDKKQTKQRVWYDREYVLDYFYRKLSGVGFGDNIDLQRDFLQELSDYVTTAKEREREAQLEQDAIELAEKYPVMTVQEWKMTLLSKAQKTEESQPQTKSITRKKAE